MHVEVAKRNGLDSFLDTGPFLNQYYEGKRGVIFNKPVIGGWDCLALLAQDKRVVVLNDVPLPTKADCIAFIAHRVYPQNEAYRMMSKPATTFHPVHGKECINSLSIGFMEN